jgi:hypothetical protein
VLHIREKINAYGILVLKPERKSALGRPRSKWEGNIKTTFKKWDGTVWTEFISARVWTEKGLL